MSKTLLECGVDVCERFGYRCHRPDRGPPAVAVPDPGADSLPGDHRPDRIAVEPLPDRSVTPTMIVSRLWNDHNHDRFALFVVPEAAVETARSVLDPPMLVRDRSDAGYRTFYTGPDRVPLAEGGYAAVRTDSPSFVWSEEPPTGPLDSDTAWSDSADPDSRPFPEERGEAARPRLTLRDGESVVAVLETVDALSCPPADRFPYTYRRGEDKRFHVNDAGDREVGVYDSVTAMRADAYHPVPMPLVPDHVFDDRPDGMSLRRSWGLVGVDHTGRISSARTADGSLSVPSRS
jgi:hypothetical protein